MPVLSWESHATPAHAGGEEEMKEGIRVLILEDLPSDAELNEREVRAVLPECEFLCVETRA